METLTVDCIRKLISYDKDTGEMIWNDRLPSDFNLAKNRSKEWVCNNWNSRHAGQVATHLDRRSGYQKVRIFNKNYFGHRIAFAIIHGRWPQGEVDHINGNRSDNSIKNLREVNRAINMRNAKRSKANSSGVTGVRWHKASGKWSARIHVNYKDIHLGLFDEFKSAVAARKKAELLHGFHKNHGRKQV